MNVRYLYIKYTNILIQEKKKIISESCFSMLQNVRYSYIYF